MPVISNSKLKSWTRCQRLYYYSWVLKLQPKRKREQLEKGTLTHSCLEAYYRSGMDPKAILRPIKLYRKKLSKLFEEEQVLYESIPADAATILRSYHRHWRDDKRIEVLEHDGEPVIERAYVVPLTGNIEVGFTIDLGVKDKLGEWVADHKTAKQLPSDDFRMTDTQSTIYMWGFEQVRGKPVTGMLWNYIRTKTPTVPEVLQNGKLSRRKNMDTDRYTYLKAIKALGQDPEDYADMLETLPSSKNFYHRIRCPRNKYMLKETLTALAVSGKRIASLEGEQNPRYYVRSISFMCDRCEFRTLCTAEMMGHDTKFIIKKSYEPRKEDNYGKGREEEEA